jgi:hypothetical protein
MCKAWWTACGHSSHRSFPGGKPQGGRRDLGGSPRGPPASGIRAPRAHHSCPEERQHGPGTHAVAADSHIQHVPGEVPAAPTWRTASPGGGVQEKRKRAVDPGYDNRRAHGPGAVASRPASTGSRDLNPRREKRGVANAGSSPLRVRDLPVGTRSMVVRPSRIRNLDSPPWRDDITRAPAKPATERARDSFPGRSEWPRPNGGMRERCTTARVRLARRVLMSWLRAFRQACR